MAVAEHESGTKTFGAVGDTWSVVQTTTPETTDGAYQFFIDTSAMAAGDTFEVEVIEKITSGGTARTVFRQAAANVQAQPGLVTPTLILLHGWDFRLRQRAGTARAFPWSIRKAG